MAWLLPGPKMLGGVTLDIHSLLYASLAVVIGFQSVLFWIFAKIYGMREGIVPPDPEFRATFRAITLENGLIGGGILLLVGLVLGILAVGSWKGEAFGALLPGETMRLVIPSATAILLGFDMAYGAFFISVLEIRTTRRPVEEIAPANERAEVIQDAERPI
jgi:hypothetical protein